MSETRGPNCEHRNTSDEWAGANQIVVVCNDCRQTVVVRRNVVHWEEEEETS